MPKDNENLPFPDLGSLAPSEPQGFAADQMVRCEECLRANPPTRVNCLYCGVALPVTEVSARLQKPSLRRLEKWEQGFNCILQPPRQRGFAPQAISDAAALLKLSEEDLRRILSVGSSLPVARAASLDEASLLSRRLAELGFETFTVADEKLNGSQPVVRVRAAIFYEDALVCHPVPANAVATELPFGKIDLLVVGRLFFKRVEVKERKSRRAEADIVNASEFFKDVAILDIHAVNASWRIEANNFDFSLLGELKTLVAGENLNTLISLIRERAPHLEVDQSYGALRQSLEPVWPSEQRSESIGWKRDRPGRYSTSEATESSNEDQFSRYSRLRHFLKLAATRHE